MTGGKLLLCGLTTLALCGPAAGADRASPAATVKGTVSFDGRPTADAVVSIEGIPRDAAQARISASKRERGVLDQRGMMFIPRVLPVLAGATVDFPNHDKTWHNVYSASDSAPFDLGLYPPGKTRSVTFDKAAVVRVLCNVHPTMEAFVVVKEHPFFSASDGRGNYRIDSVPPGKYRLAVWHPDVGTVEVVVELARDRQVLDVNFDLKK